MTRPTLDVTRSIAGRIALVTGGVSGIGEACVTALLAHGASVAFTYAEGRESAEVATERALAAGGRASAHALDLRQPDSISRCFAEVMERWGAIDILVNNAAVGSATVAAYALDKAAEDSVMLAINADGALKVCQAFLRHMRGKCRDAPLKIVSMSSVGGGIAIFPGFRLSDGMSKAAVAFMTRQLAAELMAEAIDVFAICPRRDRHAHVSSLDLERHDTGRAGGLRSELAEAPPDRAGRNRRSRGVPGVRLFDAAARRCP